MVVIAISAIVFRSIESALYAAVVIFVSSKVIDYILYGMAKSKMLMVVTDRADEISQELVNNSPRGVSIIPAKGAFTGQEKNMLICVLRCNEVAPAIKLIKSIDPNTFTIITEANEIIGKGQSMELYSPSIKGDWKIINGRKFYVFTEGCFLGLQALGDSVEPCFEGAAFFSLYEDLKKMVA